MASSNYAKFNKSAKDKREESKRLAAAKRAAADKIIRDLGRQGQQEKAQEKEESPWLQLQRQQHELRKQKYEDQKARQKEKAKTAGDDARKKAEKQKQRALNALKEIGAKEIVQPTDGTATAVQKAAGNVGRSLMGAGKAAYHGIKSLQAKKEAERLDAEAKKKAEESPDKKPMGQPGRPRNPQQEPQSPAVQKALAGTQVKGLLPPESRRKAMGRRLPPATDSGVTRVGQPAPGSRPQLPGSMKRNLLPAAGEPGPTRIATGTTGARVGQPAPERPQLGYGVDKRRMLPPSTAGAQRIGQPAAGSRTEPTLGQQARMNPALRAKLTKARGGQTDFGKAKRKVLGLEEYTWKELLIFEAIEFLSEVDKKEQKKTKRRDVIDIMKGKNKVIINPMQEAHSKILGGDKMDDEGNMAKSQLKTMERAIKALNKKIKKGSDQLPAWVQSKITKATDDIDTASDYLQSDVKESVDKDKMKCNKPKAQAHGSGESGKSHIVKACEGGKEKIIRFGQLGVKGSPKKEGESEEYASRRNGFKTRHAKNIARGKMSAAYWANKVKW